MYLHAFLLGVSPVQMSFDSELLRVFRIVLTLGPETSIREKTGWEISISDGSRSPVWLVCAVTLIKLSKQALRRVAVSTAPLIGEPLSLIFSCFLVLVFIHAVSFLNFSQICLWFPSTTLIKLKKKFAFATLMSFVTLFLREIKFSGHSLVSVNHH